MKITNKTLLEFFLKEWKQRLHQVSDGKLCTYSTFKTNFGLEKYLLIIKNFEQRCRLTKFRISAHKLNIETGRYKGIPRHNRLCTRCDLNVVEDETHFLCVCPGVNNIRQELETTAHRKCKNFASLESKTKLIWLLTNEDLEILNLICSFLAHI